MRRRTLLRAAAGTMALPAVTRRGAATQSFEPLGRVRLGGATEVVVAEDGRTAFLATTTGFATVDVSDPQNPRVLVDRRGLLSDRENGPLRDIRDVKVDGDRLAVVGPANPSEGIAAMVLYDVSDPQSPEQVAVHETDYAIHNAFLAGGRAYLSQFNSRTVGVAVVDIGNDDPRQVGQWSILDEPGWGEVPLYLVPVHDLWVQDGTAYIAHWDAGTWLLDVSRPENPRAITRVGGRPRRQLTGAGESAQRAVLTPPGNAHYVTVNDDASILGVGVESWRAEGQGGPGGITLWDIETPTNPRRLARIDPPPTPDATYNGVWTTAHNFDFAGERLYSSWYQGGVKIHDVSDPRNPQELAHWRRTAETSFWAATLAVPGEFFVASSWNQYGALDRSFVYTFPDRTDGSPGSSTGTEADATGTELTSGESGGGPVPTQPTATTDGSSTSETDTDGTNGTGNEDGSTADGPGFGAVATLAGLGLGTWRYLRRARSE